MKAADRVRALNSPKSSPAAAVTCTSVLYFSLFLLLYCLHCTNLCSVAAMIMLYCWCFCAC